MIRTKRNKGKPLTAVQRREKALKILAKGGHLPKCRKCEGPDDRRAENGLCKKCNVKAEYAEREALRAKQAFAKKKEAYADRAGEWA